MKNDRLHFKPRNCRHLICFCLEIKYFLYIRSLINYHLSKVDSQLRRACWESGGLQAMFLGRPKVREYMQVAPSTRPGQMFTMAVNAHFFLIHLVHQHLMNPCIILDCPIGSLWTALRDKTRIISPCSEPACNCSLLRTWMTFNLLCLWSVGSQELVAGKEVMVVVGD